MTSNNFVNGLIEKCIDNEYRVGEIDHIVRLCVKETAEHLDYQFDVCGTAGHFHNECKLIISQCQEEA